MNEKTGAYILMVTVIVLFAAWLTHIVHCLVYAKYLLLIAGWFMFPIGIVYGVGIWFGVEW